MGMFSNTWGPGLGKIYHPSWQEGLLFQSDTFNFTTNKLVDKSLWHNDADLVGSYCGTAKVGTVMTFATALSGLLGAWTMTYQGTAIAVLALDKITFSGAGTIYDLRITNGTLTYYYPICESNLKVFDVSGNAKHITVSVSTLAEWTANTQDVFHYNLQHGGGLIGYELLSNPKFEGTYTNGLANGWTNFTTLTKTEETTTVHEGTKAQRFTANAGYGVYRNVNVKANYEYHFSCWVYVLSGKAELAIYGSGVSTLIYSTHYISTTTNGWELLTIETFAKVDGSINFKIVANGGASEIICDDASTYFISPTVSIPALLTGVNDALGNAITIPTSNYKVETKIKLPATSGLIASDVDSFFFTAGTANSVPLSSLQFALKNMVYDNTIFFNNATAELLIYKSNVGSTSKLKALLNHWAESFIHGYRYYKEKLSVDATLNLCVHAVNRNFRLAGKANIYFVFSNNNGLTWGTPYNYTSITANVLKATITSKGTIIVFGKNNVIKRSADGAGSFQTITPTDINGDAIVPHTPVNGSYPGTYYRPYNKILDIYDSVHDTNLLIWGNWGNSGYGANPARLYYSTDDGATIKTFYEFGQNTIYTDTGTATPGTGGTLLGNAGSTIIARHVHEVSYNEFDGKFYIACGDSDTNGVHILTFTYNSITDTWSAPTDIVTLPTQRQRLIGLGFDSEGYIYFGSDGDAGTITQNSVTYNPQGVYKCLITDINDLSKHILLHAASDIVVSFYMDGNILFFTIGDGSSKIVYISRDKGVTWIETDFTSLSYYYDLDFQPTQVQFFMKDSQNNYFAQTASDGFYINVVP